VEEALPSDEPEDLEKLFAEVNNLPADDPLRGTGNGQQALPSAANEIPSSTEPAQRGPLVAALPPLLKPVHTAEPALEAKLDAKPEAKTEGHSQNAMDALVAASPEPHPSGHGVVVDAGNRIGVPSFVGQPLRVAVESAATVGLALQIVGSGIAREQVPAPGSLVPRGSEIVVRFTR
jgi:cell division protein FtsI (penicillin-binding protein 3)